MKKLATLTAAIVLVGCSATKPNMTYVVPEPIKMDRAGSSLTYAWVQTKDSTGSLNSFGALPIEITEANWGPAEADARQRCKEWGYSGNIERFSGMSYPESRTEYVTSRRVETNIQCL